MDISFWGKKDQGPAWPMNTKGEKEQAALLMDAFDSASDSDMIVSLLAAYGIPCFKFYDKDGGAGKVINGFSGYGAGLYVPASMLDDANALLQAEPVLDDNEEDQDK